MCVKKNYIAWAIFTRQGALLPNTIHVRKRICVYNWLNNTTRFNYEKGWTVRKVIIKQQNHLK